MQNLHMALLFLLEITFELVGFILLMRLILQWVQADFHNPLSQIIFKFSQPIVKPFNTFLPTLKRINLGVLVPFILLVMIKIYILSWLATAPFPNPLGLMVYAFGDLIKQILNLMFYALLIQVILSWVQPMGQSPVAQLLARITSPIMTPIRRIIPPVGGIDFSPIPAMLLIKLLELLLIMPIMQLAQSLS